MPVEKSAGAIIFRREGNRIYYLLLHYPPSAKASRDYWDFPKGHIEKGEKPIDTAKREILEETGLEDIRILEGFKETIKYFFNWRGKKVLKFVTFYLAEIKKKKVKISSEHIGWEWLLYEEAFQRLTFENSKKILEKANAFLILIIRS